MRSQRKRKHKWLVPAILFVLIAAFFCALYIFWVPRRHADLIRSCAEEYGVDEELVFAVIRTESNFRADAVSSAGAVGLMQLMPSTAEFAAKVLGAEGCDLFDPQDNVRLGTWYLRYLSERFDRLDEVLAAYNAGEGTVRRWLREPSLLDAQGNLARIPYAETQRYVERAKNFYFCYNFFY